MGWQGKILWPCKQFDIIHFNVWLDFFLRSNHMNIFVSRQWDAHVHLWYI
jgi:hypothetical protein